MSKKRAFRHILFQTQKYGQRPAIITESATTSYHRLQWGAHHVANNLNDLNQDRIAFLATPNESYVMHQWGIWAAGGVAVPLHCHHPRKEWEYVLEDAQVSGILVSDDSTSLVESAKALSIPVIDATTSSAMQDETMQDETFMPEWTVSNLEPQKKAQILYTSGTTGRPKGVVMNHGNLQQQIDDIVSTWELTSKDRLLHFLPLHHTHGIMNNLLCPLFAGATVEMMPKADPSKIWEKYYTATLESSSNNTSYTLMMAVPTIYMKLLEAVPDLSLDQKQKALETAKQLRVKISGSAACPIRIMDEWERLTGHRLLERYGMTELGMALTNPLHGERVQGYVGRPFPSVEVRVVDPETQEKASKGELRVKGPGIFSEYWNRPEETAKEFDDQGWFKTGDIAEYNEALKSYRILGRASVDILKSGGYKISALEIEACILEHQGVAECHVLGLEDETWGEIIVAIVRLRKDCVLADVQSHAKKHLASYKVPRKWIEMEEIPKNAMGKVNKKQLRSTVQEI